MNLLKELIKEALELEIKELDSHPHSKEDDIKINNLKFIVEHIEHGEIELAYNQGKR